MRNTIIQLGIFCSLLCFNLQANNPPLYVSASPGVTFGYTFGKGWNASLYMDIGLLKQQLNTTNLYHGLNISYTFFTHKSEMYASNLYRTFSFNYLVKVDNFTQLKLGMAKTKLKWGLNNRNSKGTVWGLNIQAEAMPLQNGLLVGLRYFKLNNQCMGIGGKEPKFIYAGFQNNLIESIPNHINL